MRYPSGYRAKETLEARLHNNTCTCLIAIAIAIAVARAMAAAAAAAAADAGGAMSPSVGKRKHTQQPAPPTSPKRTRTESPGIADHLAVADLEAHVRQLGAKVFAFRCKGLPFFARLTEERRADLFSEGVTDTAPTESKKAQEDLRQVLKARLAVANSTLPTLLDELVMWNTKIQQAVDVKRKDQRLPFLDEEEDGS